MEVLEVYQASLRSMWKVLEAWAGYSNEPMKAHPAVLRILFGC